MSRILLIDDDTDALDTIGRIVTLAEHEFAGAATGRDGLRLAAEFDPEVALVDQFLPDLGGVDVVRHLHRDRPWTACLIVTGDPTLNNVVEAMRAGATDWLTKPLFEEDLLAAIARALSGRPSTSHVLDVDLERAEPHAVTRLAEAAIQFIASREDKPTLRTMGREMGHAAGCLRNWCRTAAVRSMAFRDFARALRTVYRLQHDPAVPPANLLKIIDERTLRRFCVKSGGTRDRLPVTVDSFLERQQFITDPAFVAAVREALAVRSSGSGAQGTLQRGTSKR